MESKQKKSVYNGYEEMYVTGLEMQRLFQNEYYASGRHHSVIKGISITEYLYFIGVQETTKYRLFYNKNFCKVMDERTDKEICFFSHFTLENVKISVDPHLFTYEKMCPQCGAHLKFKKGRYGEFIGCSNYPNCKYSKNIPIIGNYTSTYF